MKVVCFQMGFEGSSRRVSRYYGNERYPRGEGVVMNENAYERSMLAGWWGKIAWTGLCLAATALLVFSIGISSAFADDEVVDDGLSSELAASSVVRLQGPIALDTMKSISTEGFADDSCSEVVVATTDGYWDALTACGFAGLSSTPVLLTDSEALSVQTASEIERLGAETVYVAGGPAAVSDNVVHQIRAITGVGSVERLAGETAVGTAIEVFKGGKGWGDTAIVATSASFHDALSIAPYAYANNAPIFLAEADSGILSDESLEAIKSGGFKKVYIVGGKMAVYEEVEAQLGTLFAGRHSGATAYETSVAIANWCVSEGMSADKVGIATGTDYYDALAGAALCGKNNSALVLISDDNRVAVSGFLTPHASRIASAYVFGGPAAVSHDAFGAIAYALG